VTSVVNTDHVMTFARCEQDEPSVGMDSVRGGSVTACVDLQKKGNKECVVRISYLGSRG